MKYIKLIFAFFITFSSLISAAEMNKITHKQAYEILSKASGIKVNPSSSKNDIKKSYRKALLKWHPDQNKENQEEATEKTKWINHAYELLTKQIPHSSSSDNNNEQKNYPSKNGSSWHSKTYEAAFNHFNSEDEEHDSQYNNEFKYEDAKFQEIEDAKFQEIIDKGIKAGVYKHRFILKDVIECFENYKNKKPASNSLSDFFGAKIYFQLAKLILESSLIENLTIEDQINTLKETYSLAVKALKLNEKSREITDFTSRSLVKKCFYEQLYNPFLEGKKEYNLRNNNTAKAFFENFFDSVDYLKNRLITDANLKVSFDALEIDKIECFIELLRAKSKFYLGEIHYTQEDDVAQNLNKAFEYLSSAKKYFQNPRIPKVFTIQNDDSNFEFGYKGDFSFTRANKITEMLNDIERHLKNVNTKRACVIQ